MLRWTCFDNCTRPGLGPALATPEALIRAGPPAKLCAVIEWTVSRITLASA